MTITQLQYVLAVAEFRNFTVAAEKSFVTQPTLSMQVQKLEDELDVQIFDRSKKPIGITDAGQKIVDQARNIVNEASRIRDIVDQEKGFIGGTFTLGIIPTVMPTLLPMFLKNFVSRYPKVRLVIREQNTEALIENLKEGHLDAAIAATPLGVESLTERPLYYEPFVAYVPEGHRLSAKEKLAPEDLALQDILLLQDGHCFRDGVINLCKSGDSDSNEPFELESGSFETLIRLSDEGLGMTLLPYLHTLDLDPKRKKRLRFFTEPPPAREVSLIYHRKELKFQISEALKEVISGVVRGAIRFQDVQIISPTLNGAKK
ncbi:LysR family transcriptional regulator, hydrogen peroxide-inducible genes activator [Robiginitalea myxolifaciens]|uniref:LysR family transcriptional regulator, hydrogen peroxide-inducible genes activator n=1 Tax=Robiginitalea myxolifaciens TaxID=400055 RepID=A0A1I6FMV6_9FLAO|nr:hydrogen peroxide-inducible genes activator [Robiginitalea myxolifaciens]SFR31283.1 LysR family transcriptional regulator, hydrogen peroxide-inducible genes activator [Robiginitalea myxolifaciens]